MAKKQLKHYVLLGILLLGIPLLLTNCEKEFSEDFEIPAQQSRFSVNILDNDDVELNNTLLYKIKEITNLKAISDNFLAAREIYNEDYGFTINTDYVKRLEDTETGNHSYSFPIIRDNPITEHVENLLLHANDNGGYDAYIIEYNFTAEEYLAFNETTSTNFETTLTPINFDIDVFNDGELSKTVYICTEQWSWGIIDDGDEGELVGDENAEQYTFGWMLTGISCGYYDDGTGGVTDSALDGSTSGSGGTGTGTSSNPDPDNGFDPTSPNNYNGTNNNDPVIAVPTANDPNIQKLNSLTRSTQVKGRITKLSENREYGYQFNLASLTTYNITSGVLDTKTNGICFPYISFTTKLQVHTHYTGLDNTFSSEDLSNFARLVVNSNNPDTTAMLVAPNGKLSFEQGKE